MNKMFHALTVLFFFNLARMLPVADPSPFLSAMVALSLGVLLVGYALITGKRFWESPD